MSSTSKRSAKETGFLKTFPSDIDDASVLKLLMEIRTGDALYRDFTTRDMKLLSQLISALQFQPGDKIIQKNEEASFLGIVLKGTFASVIDDKLNVALRRGEMFGELEFMEGGLRKADMVAATQGVLGILTYEDVKLIGLTSVDLHMRLLQAISVSSIKKLRQGGVSVLGSATPKVRSRRASFSMKDSPTISTSNLNREVGASPSASPSMSPSYRIVKNDDLPMLDSASMVRTESSSSAPDESLSSPSPSPMSPDPTAGAAIVINNAVSTPLSGPQPEPPQLVGDEEALAAAVAAATTDEGTPASSSKHIAKKHSEDGLELLFRYRMKKNPSIKPRRIEADVMNLLDATIPTSSRSDSKDGVTLPPLASGGSGTSDKQPGSARGSMTGGGMQNLPINSQASPASSPAASSSGDKNYNYVLYTLRNKVARQEDMLDEKDRQLMALQTELKAALEVKERETTLRFEMEMKCEGLSNGIRSAEERVQKAENDVHSLREQLVKKSQQMEAMEAERKMMLEATGLTMANMHAKLIEHGEMLEVEGISGAAAGSSGSASGNDRNASASSSSTAASSINAKDSKGSKFLASTSSLPASMQSSSSLSRNSSSGALSNSPSVKPAKPSQLFPPSSSQHSHSNSSVLLLSDQMTDYASQYEHMMSKLKDRLADQERQLIAMTKWKTRAQEFANTWDQERTRLKDRIKHGLIEIENLKTQKDSYKILLKILTVKLFMQHSQIRKTMKGFYRKMVELTTDILMEQKFSAGANGNKGMVNRGQSVQLENAEELLVRIQQKLSSKPWNTFALGSGAGAASSSLSQGIMGGLMGVGGRSSKPNQRPPTLKVLLDSMDDELGTLVTANHEVLKSKRQWEETAQSFFLRNIELTQTISEHDTQLQQTKANLKTMERSLDEKDENLSTARTSLASLEQNHKSALQAIHSNDARNKGDIRAKKAEVESLFEKNVALRRKIREGELTITELEKKELRLHEKNEALLQEQRALIQAISNAKEVESQLLKGNHSQLNLLLQSQSSPHINASHLIASSPTSSKSLAPLIHSPTRPNAPYSNNYMQNGGSNPIYPRAASIPTLFQQTMPVNGHSMQSQSSFGHLSQSSFITAPYATQSFQSTNSDGSLSHSQPPTQSLPVLATIRARPQAAQNAPLLTPQQWASFATLPPNLQPLSARPPPSLQPQSRKQRGGASTARVDKEKYAAVEKQQAHATKLALASALQRDSLDRALFRAAKAGLGRGFGTGAAKKIRKGPSHSGSVAHLQPSAPLESKEESMTMPQPPSTVSLKHMMENQSPD